MVDEAESFVTQYIDQTFASAQDVMNTEATQETIEDICGQYPMLKPFVEQANIQNLAPSQLPHAICQGFRDSLNNYILQKSLWSGGLYLVGLLLICLLPSQAKGSSRRSRPGARAVSPARSTPRSTYQRRQSF